MRNEFTSLVERDGEWFVASTPEVRGANGQGRTREEAIASLREAIELILADRKDSLQRGVQRPDGPSP